MVRYAVRFVLVAGIIAGFALLVGLVLFEQVPCRVPVCGWPLDLIWA